MGKSPPSFSGKPDITLALFTVSKALKRLSKPYYMECTSNPGDTLSETFSTEFTRSPLWMALRIWRLALVFWIAIILAPDTPMYTLRVLPETITMKGLPRRR
jgi:hypothetical protein